jgi:hypothetical protein
MLEDDLLDDDIVAGIVMKPTSPGRRSPRGEAAQLRDKVAGNMTLALDIKCWSSPEPHQRRTLSSSLTRTLDVKRRFVLQKTEHLFYFSSLQYKKVGYKAIMRCIIDTIRCKILKHPAR